MTIFSKAEKAPEQQEEQAPEFPKKGQSHNSTMIAYSVEVRYMGHRPAIVNGMALGKEWQRPNFEKVEPPIPGVPIGAPWHLNMLSQVGLYDYCAAQALRWWFHANAEASSTGAMCLESRIVAHRVKHSISEESVSAHVVVSGEDRTSIVPDWNTDKQPRTDK